MSGKVKISPRTKELKRITTTVSLDLLSTRLPTLEDASVVSSDRWVRNTFLRVACLVPGLSGPEGREEYPRSIPIVPALITMPYGMPYS